MEKDQIFKHAQQMFLNGAGRKAVMDFLSENGVSDDAVETMATEAYKSVREKIQELKLEAGQENAVVGQELDEGKGGMGGVLIGALILVGGIVATMFTDRIWYGAIIVGAIAILRSVFK